MNAAAIKELLTGQAVRPDSVTVGGQHRLVPGFTTDRFADSLVKADSCSPGNSGFREMPLDDLVKLVEAAIGSGRGNFSFGYQGADLTLDGTGCSVRCRADHLSLKQAATYASHLALIVQFGRKLFDEMR